MSIGRNLTPAKGSIVAIAAFVVVSCTGGDGLKRSDPSLTDDCASASSNKLHVVHSGISEPLAVPKDRVERYSSFDHSIIRVPVQQGASSGSYKVLMSDLKFLTTDGIETTFHRTSEAASDRPYGPNLLEVELARPGQDTGQELQALLQNSRVDQEQEALFLPNGWGRDALVHIHCFEKDVPLSTCELRFHHRGYEVIAFISRHHVLRSQEIFQQIRDQLDGYAGEARDLTERCTGWAEYLTIRYDRDLWTVPTASLTSYETRSRNGQENASFTVRGWIERDTSQIQLATEIGHLIDGRYPSPDYVRFLINVAQAGESRETSSPPSGQAECIPDETISGNGVMPGQCVNRSIHGDTELLITVYDSDPEVMSSALGPIMETIFAMKRT